MWLLLPPVLILLAILATSATVRRVQREALAAFFGAGMGVGMALAAILFLHYGIGTRSLAGLALYAAGCELYLIAISVVRTSIGGRVLRLVDIGVDTPDSIQANLKEEDMLSVRLNRLVTDGLLRDIDGDRVEVTERGRRIAVLMTVVRRLLRQRG